MDEVQKLEQRVERLENKISADLDKIFAKLEALALASAKSSCPQPGLCVLLQMRINELKTTVDKTQLETTALSKWQSYILGATAIALVLLTFFGPAIRYKLGIPQ